MSQHTPGPWEIRHRDDTVDELQIIRRDDRYPHLYRVVADVNTPDADAEGIANAKLIAAAPKMRELLESIENDAQQVPEWFWNQIQAVVAGAGGTPKKASLNQLGDSRPGSGARSGPDVSPASQEDRR